MKGFKFQVRDKYTIKVHLAPLIHTVCLPDIHFVKIGSGCEITLF